MTFINALLGGVFGGIPLGVFRDGQLTQREVYDQVIKDDFIARIWSNC